MKIKEKKHLVEELHRGQWIQLIGDNKKPKHVMITEETAKRMNEYANEEKIRYVLAEDKEEEGFDVDKPHSKAELVAHAESLNIELTGEETKAEIIEKIKAA